MSTHSGVAAHAPVEVTLDEKELAVREDEALLACAAVTLRSVATIMEIPIRAGTAEAEGEIDFRGTLGVSREAPVGFVAIRLFFTLDTDAAEETLEKLARLTDRYCVVSQSLNVRPTLTVRRQLSA